MECQSRVFRISPWPRNSFLCDLEQAGGKGAVPLSPSACCAHSSSRKTPWSREVGPRPVGHTRPPTGSL